MRDRAAAIWIVSAAVCLAVAPLATGTYGHHLLTTALMNVTLASSWNLLLLSGQISLGHAAFFGLGAYTAALLQARVPVLVGIVLGGAVATLAAFGIGAICLRMRGIYFAIATLAFTEALRVAATMLDAVTAGPAGITIVSSFGREPLLAYYVVFALAEGCLLMAWAIGRSRLQVAFDALRQDQLVADSLGVDPTLYKLLAFGLSSCFAGMAGAFYAHYVTFVVPDTAFSVHVSLEAQLMTILGGVRTLVGPPLGALVLTFLQEVLGVYFVQINQLLYGVLLVAVILLAPRGLLGIRVARRADPVLTKS